MNEKFALIWVKAYDEPANGRFHDIAAKCDGLATQPSNLRFDVGNFKGDQRTTNWCAMFCVRSCDDKRAVAEVVLNPVIAHRARLDSEDRVVEAAGYRNVADRIGYK